MYIKIPCKKGCVYYKIGIRKHEKRLTPFNRKRYNQYRKGVLYGKKEIRYWI